MTNPMIMIGLAAFVLMIPSWADAEDQSRASSKLKPADLVGGYALVSGEKFGDPEPEERIKETTVRFTEDRIVVTDKDKEEVYGSTYTLDTATNPCRITMISKLATSEGQIAKGLIEKKGDTIRLIYALPGGEEPADFKTKERQLMFVMKSLRK
jgi:uncharacterized protein (TIGR03067 family)